MPTILHPGFLLNILVNEGRSSSANIDAMLLEQGTLSLFELEDGTGYIILE